MKKEEQKTNAQLSVLDNSRALQKRTASNAALLVTGVAATAVGLWMGGWVLALTVVGSIAFFDYMRRRWQNNPVIEVQAQSVENVLRSRLAKLKFGEHPAQGERIADLHDRYRQLFKRSEKILYEKLSPEELTAHRFQKLLDEMKENLHTNFETLAQTLEISTKSNLDQSMVTAKLEGIEKDLFEITQTMDSLQQAQLGKSVSTFDQSFLIEEMKKLTSRIQKLE